MNILLVNLLLFFINKSRANSDLQTRQDQLFMKLNHKNVKLSETSELSQECDKQLRILTNGEHNQILLKMVDASSKILYPGMLEASRIELGNFDECISIDHTYNEVRILGKYCLAGLVMPDFSNASNFDLYYKMSTCIPDACTADDLLSFPKYFYNGFPSLFIDNFCTTKEDGREFSVETIASICVFAAFALAVLLSTLYDIYYQRKDGGNSSALYSAFSIIPNTKNILKISLEQSRENIDVFNGFRFISVLWIIAAHVPGVFYRGYFPIINEKEAMKLFDRRYITYLVAANLAVTTFFFMSGFLVSYLYFKTKRRSWLNQLKEIPLFYVQRYLRLTIPLVFIYLFVVWIFPKTGSGPMWKFGNDQEIGPCHTYWWSYFLHLQNYVNWDRMCLVPYWYLAVDMQLFLLSPLIIIPVSTILKYKNGFNKAMALLGLLNIFFILLNIGIRELFPHTTNNPYDTQGRLAEYFIGFTMGFFMRFNKEEPFLGSIKNKSAFNLVFWTISLSLMLTLFTFYQDAVTMFDHLNRTLFLSFGRVIWTIGLSWILYSCYHGYGGFVNWFLCSPCSQIGGKISFSMYLLHFPVLYHYAFSNRIKWFYSDYINFYLSCGIIIETFFWSFLWMIVFEGPILTLHKYFFKNLKATIGKYTVKNHRPAENNV